ncbi:hypothetical protein MMC30_009079 [Trapelia coarctata]|nr:hypothetical protein [Trapelia coarctata]
MSSLAQLEAYTSELAAAVEKVAKYCRNIEVPVDFAAGNTPQPLVPPEAPSEAHRARRSIVANVAKLQTLLAEPADFLQQLAGQNQLLACLHWLGEFQVLACIPLSGSVPFKDVADLTGVPETQLCRVVRMMATAGFLHEPHLGHVAHSALSTPFVTKPTFLDAAMFLSETAAPTALQMAVATQRFGHSQRPNESAYNVAFNTSATFASACEQRPKLQRQWPAYLRYGTDDVDASVTDILTRLDWLSLGNASVVEVGARSTAIAMALADLYPALHFIVQISESGPSGHVRQQSMPNSWPPASPTSFGRAPTPGPRPDEMRQQLGSRITVQQRTPGTLQSVYDAAVYILRLPSPSPGVPSHLLPARIIAELRAHMGVLRASSSATLVLTARLLPEPGTVDPDVEAIARLRDLSLLQLANEREIEVLELMDILNSVRDSMGRLVLVNKLRSHNNATVALEVRYQAYADRHDLPPALANV